jgi:hypothetical protein
MLNPNDDLVRLMFHSARTQQYINDRNTKASQAVSGPLSP